VQLRRRDTITPAKRAIEGGRIAEPDIERDGGPTLGIPGVGYAARRIAVRI
jgi:hypothetical protein